MLNDSVDYQYFTQVNARNTARNARF